MKIRHTTSWQVILSDLSLIMFLTVLSGFAGLRSKAETGAAETGAAETGAAETGKAETDDAKAGKSVADYSAGQMQYRDGNGSLEFAEWLDMERKDSRARLTITVRYDSGDFSAAWQKTKRMAQIAKDQGLNPRIIMENGTSQDIRASFTYDRMPLDKAPSPQTSEITQFRPASLAR